MTFELNNFMDYVYVSNNNKVSQLKLYTFLRNYIFTTVLLLNVFFEVRI